MKRLIAIIAITTSLLCPSLVLSGQAAAASIIPVCDPGQTAANTDVCKDVQAQKNNPSNPIVKIIRGAINVLSVIIGIAAIIGILVGSIRMITADGDTNAVASARSAIIYSLVGVVVAALAQVIVVFVLNNIR